MFTLVDYVGGSTAHFRRGLEWNRTQRVNMVICFAQPIRHGGDFLHLAPPRIILPQPMGLSLGMYNIWGGSRFGLPQAIWAIERGNYVLILLTEKKIL